MNTTMLKYLEGNAFRDDITSKKMNESSGSYVRIDPKSVNLEGAHKAFRLFIDRIPESIDFYNTRYNRVLSSDYIIMVDKYSGFPELNFLLSITITDKSIQKDKDFVEGIIKFFNSQLGKGSNKLSKSMDFSPFKVGVDELFVQFGLNW